jgi:metallo-beta-lactamase family protein
MPRAARTRHLLSSLTMLGACGSVTGSKFLLETAGRRTLIECGLFQGQKDLRLRNWAPLPVDPATIDDVVVTHAHLDHSGYLPRLARAGFTGRVHVTPDTAALLRVVLPDSGRLNEEEAEFANRIGSSRHHPALPLYSEADAFAAIELLDEVPFGTSLPIGDELQVRFDVAGHILGAATLRCELAGGVVLRCSGDLGRPAHPLLRPPAPVGEADWIVVESTYGDRDHGDDDPVEQLREIVDVTVERGGIVVIPSFAVDRADVLLHHLGVLRRAGRIPDVPIFLDSPMALAALDVYRTAIEEGHPDVRPELVGRTGVLDVPGLQRVHDADASRAISRRHDPAIVIAGAGMAAGGRVVHHLEAFLPHARNAVVLVGFQAAGTRGRSLLDGASSVKIHGRYVPVRARVCDLTGFSVHADRSELLDWLATASRPPDGVFVVHGEPAASAALRAEITGRLGWTAVEPRLGERLTLRTIEQRP